MLISALLFALGASFCGLFYVYRKLIKKISDLQNKTEENELKRKDEIHDIRSMNSQIYLSLSLIDRKLEDIKQVKQKKLPGANRNKRTPEQKERARQQALERNAKKKAAQQATAQVVQPVLNHAPTMASSGVS